MHPPPPAARGSLPSYVPLCPSLCRREELLRVRIPTTPLAKARRRHCGDEYVRILLHARIGAQTHTPAAVTTGAAADVFVVSAAVVVVVALPALLPARASTSRLQEAMSIPRMTAARARS
eukprot:GHVU01209692.1.p3 GENE.GHVU01209692.1~~GHVU01209692.1.p3  ORF type:complete len:120 (-),score=10.43 GHVU01209692.1:427-786(-)